MNIQNAKIYGLDNAIKCSKYPMSIDIENCNSDITDTTRALGRCKQGSGEDNYLKGVIVQFDLTFSIKAWIEAERYHFLDFISSQSTMHKIVKMDIMKQCNEYVDPRNIAVLKEKVCIYNSIEEKDSEEAKKAFLECVYNIPAGFEMTAGMTTNYQQLKTIYYQRRYHRLPEWKAFCKWIEGMPKFKELILGGN